MIDDSSESFDAFFRKHVVHVTHHLVRRGVDPVFAKDAVEDAMVTLCEGWNDIHHPLTWVRETAYWRARDMIKYRRNLVELTDLVEHTTPDLHHFDEDPVCQQESAARVQHLLRGLPDRRRAVICLWLDDYRDGEIARELQITEAMVRSHKRFALRDIAAILKAEGGRS